MNKKIIIYIGILILLIIVISYIDTEIPKKKNWSPTYGIQDKNPFGLYVFNNEKKHLFNDCTIQEIKVSPYEYFLTKNDSIYNTQNKKKETFIYINHHTKIDNQSLIALLKYVSKGNTAFLSAQDFPRLLLDSLKVNQTLEYNSTYTVENYITNPVFLQKKFKYKEESNFAYFDKFDPSTTKILGKIKVNNNTYTNFIKIKYLQGTIFLHNQPQAFTNFYLLHKNKNYQYAAQVVSHLPSCPTYWFTGKMYSTSKTNSPMRYILSQPPLRWAWYLFLSGTLLFMLFNAKRKQRIIPIIKPLPNTTIEFVKTIGNLYYQEANYNSAIQKKIIYFLEKIRNQYHIDTTTLDQLFITKLQQKTGKPLAEIEYAVHLIHTYKNNQNKAAKEDLIKIVKTLENLTQK